MKNYISKSVVRAARILSVTDGRDGAPFYPDLENDECEEMSWRTWCALARDVLKGNPPGYLVFYPNDLDGYVPLAEFERDFKLEEK